MDRILCPKCKEKWILPEFKLCRKCRRKEKHAKEHADYLKRRVEIRKRNMERQGQTFAS